MQAKSCLLSPTIDQSVPHFVEKLFTGALFTLTVCVTVACAPVYSSEVSAPQKTRPAPASSLPDGTYLYGESSAPNQVGATYMVLDVHDRQVVGAFYAPSSSFDCFRGQVHSNQLALNVADSYNRTSYPYSVALQKNAQVASANQPETAPVQLHGYHRLQTVSQNDYKLLSTCQARYSAIGQGKR
jgi:hypothetical protein